MAWCRQRAGGAEAHAVLPTGGTSDWKIPPPESWHLTATASSSAAWLPLRLRIMSRLLSSQWKRRAGLNWKVMHM